MAEKFRSLKSKNDRVHGMKRVLIFGVELFVASVMALAVAGCASLPMAQLNGTVSYRERIALPPEAQIRVAIEDISKADSSSLVVAEQIIHPSTQVPVPFAIRYDAHAISAGKHYALVAEIRDVANGLLWRTDKVIDPFASKTGTDKTGMDSIDLVLKRVGGKNKPLAPWHYRCDDVDFTFAPGNGETARLFFNQRHYKVKQVPSASGARYEGEGVMFWSKGRDGMLSIGGKSYEGCSGEPQ